MRILVTGGTGFIGSNIVRKLIELGHEVLITGTDDEQTIQDPRVTLLDLAALGKEPKTLGHVDAVFHEAADNDTTSLDRNGMMRANVDLSLLVFERAVENGCRNIVYASSTAVYGNGPAPYKEDQPLQPLNPYAESKKLLEEEASAFGKAHTDVTMVGLRYCNVYGPGESHKGKRASMIYQLAQQMKTGNPRIFRDGTQKRDYIYVKDVVRANLLGLEAKESCVVNCGSGSATSFNDLVKILNATLGTSRIPAYVDNPYEGRYQNHTECDMTLAKEKLGFIPEFDIQKGIANYFASGRLL
ncbi:NAD-dependent epimerase/dehydratase family protein [Candidatus Kaiserbacteria bacterium]|nr:NAD-dependent epimerase/dehydratase family protein [Candidatus Kaiserbacteria bacterium]